MTTYTVRTDNGTGAPKRNLTWDEVVALVESETGEDFPGGTTARQVEDAACDTGVIVDSDEQYDALVAGDDSTTITPLPTGWRKSDAADEDFE